MSPFFLKIPKHTFLGCALGLLNLSLISVREENSNFGCFTQERVDCFLSLQEWGVFGSFTEGSPNFQYVECGSALCEGITIYSVLPHCFRMLFLLINTHCPMATCLYSQFVGMYFSKVYFCKRIFIFYYQQANTITKYTETIENTTILISC